MTEQKFFSILMVSLNSGEKLTQTLKSVQAQTCKDYEVLIKDGGSKDDSLDMARAYLAQEPQLASAVRIVSEKDKSIYDGMNQAVAQARGQFYYFLNCGDAFASHDVLEKVKECILKTREQGSKAGIYYGDIYDALRQEVVTSNPRIDAFACYRHVPCHQSCFYDSAMFAERQYDLNYKVRADYEHFLWCFFQGNGAPEYVPVTIASYEGGGYSETAENKKRSAREHKEITGKYMTKGQLFKYKAILLLTLAPLRTAMAESPRFAGFYQGLKKTLYGFKRK